ncbi:MAG: hypothetical protein Q4B39_08885 [[Ruminococcus] gnavus]|nr:hypothetical protein [Mediterraneibacter gnavus]
MKMNYSDMFDCISDKSAEILNEYEEYELNTVFSAANTEKVVISKIMNREHPVKKKRKIWKWRVLLAAAMILSASSIVFAVKYWQFPNDGGTQLVPEKNRELIGENIQGTALIYDSEGNLINKEDAESVLGLYDWENCPLIQQIEDETAIPSTFTKIPVKKIGAQYQIPEVIFTSEALVIFTKEDGSGWELNEADEIQISLEEYETKEFRVDGQMIGYKLIHNGELKKAEEVREGIRQNCTLSVTEKGEYYPCLIGRSSDITTLKHGTITVIEK